MTDELKVTADVAKTLNDLAGPLVEVDALAPKVAEKYARITWYDSVMYGQGKDGQWYKVYEQSKG